MGKDIYRSRLEGTLEGNVLKFVSSLKEDLWIIKEDIIGTQAHNIMLFDQKILNASEIKGILISLENIKKKVLDKDLNLDESFEDIHPMIEKMVIDETGIEIGGKLHTGRSRNDQVSVDIRLKLRKNLNLLSKSLFELIDILLILSKKYNKILMPLYTHLQPGQMGVFAHYINYYVSQFLRSLERIDDCYCRINKNPLGACAIGGTSIKINRNKTSELLGFDGLIENSIDAISSRDYILETLSVLSLIATDFSRIAEDLIIWSTNEFSFIELSDKYCSVSSVMPQKKNPDCLELIRSKSVKIIANSYTGYTIVKGLPSGYLRDFQDLKMLLKESFDFCLSITDIFKGLFSTLKLKPDNMLGAIKNSYILALDLAELLVSEYNIPFRQSHKIVANLVKNSKNLEDLFKKEKIEKEIASVGIKNLSLDQNFIDQFKDLTACLNKRVSQGAPSEIEVQNFFNKLNEQKDLLLKSYTERVNKIKKSKEILKKRINELIS